MLIDVHGHIGRVLPERSEFVDAVNLIAKMDAWGIDRTCILPLSEHPEGAYLEADTEDVFLACKTTKRDAAGAREELEQSLKQLHTDHFDLYQFHAVSTMDDVKQILAPGGAGELFVKAREEGKVRYLGFSAHSAKAAIALMDAMELDSVLFPVNYVCYGQGNFGPQIIAKAKEKGVARLALKALAKTRVPKGQKRPCAKCWYVPVEGRTEAEQALRFTLSQPITGNLQAMLTGYRTGCSRRPVDRYRRPRPQAPVGLLPRI